MGILKVRAATEYVGHSIENNASLACLTVVLPARGVTCRRIIIKIKYTPCKRGETKREKKKKQTENVKKKYGQYHTHVRVGMPVYYTRPVVFSNRSEINVHFFSVFFSFLESPPTPLSAFIPSFFAPRHRNARDRLTRWVYTRNGTRTSYDNSGLALKKHKEN